jgi:hypothetical protein
MVVAWQWKKQLDRLNLQHLCFDYMKFIRNSHVSIGSMYRECYCIAFNMPDDHSSDHTILHNSVSQQVIVRGSQISSNRRIGCLLIVHGDSSWGFRTCLRECQLKPSFDSGDRLKSQIFWDSSSQPAVCKVLVLRTSQQRLQSTILRHRFEGLTEEVKVRLIKQGLLTTCNCALEITIINHVEDKKSLRLHTATTYPRPVSQCNCLQLHAPSTRRAQ